MFRKVHRILTAEAPQILLPKRWMSTAHLRTPDRIRPFFFLAGPVRGGGDWQRRMVRALQRYAEGCVVAIPCRWGEDHIMARYFVPGPECHFARQLDWELHYISLAALELTTPSALVFWLGLESVARPHPGPEPFAMDTRGEIARWSVHKKYNPAVRMVVGANLHFHGLSQIQRNINHDLGYEFSVHSTIQETAQAAVRAAYAL